MKEIELTTTETMEMMIIMMIEMMITTMIEMIIMIIKMMGIIIMETKDKMIDRMVMMVTGMVIIEM